MSAKRLTWGTTAGISYILSIFLANWLIAHFGLVPVGFGLMAPAGVFVAGAAFALRDVIQDTLGLGWVLVAIVLGTLASMLVSPHFALASGSAFLFSEISDFAVYTPLRRRSWIAAAVVSNTVGDVVDSILFLLLAFGSTDNLLGLMVGKWYVTIPVVAWWGVKRSREEKEWQS